MSEAAADPTAELRREIEDLRAALDDVRTANNSRERDEAKADVAEAEEDVREAAKRAGVPTHVYVSAIAAAKRETFLAEYGEAIDSRAREIARDELQQILAEADKQEADEALPDEDDGKPSGKNGGDKAPAKTSKANDTPPEKEQPESRTADDPPLQEHWSEKSIKEVFR